MTEAPSQLAGRPSRWLAPIGLLALALLVRLPGFTWGLPDSTHLFSYHPDEYHSLRGLFSLVLAGDLNPHFFNYGSLYLYLVMAAVLLVHPGAGLTAWADQIVGGQAQPLLRSWTLDARLVSLAASLATVYVVYLLALRLTEKGVRCYFSRRKIAPDPFFPLTAAALVALAPLSALTARYGTVDATQTLFICLSLYFSVLLFTRPAGRTALWAGVCAGLAASTKYNGAVVLVAPLLAAVLAPGSKRPPAAPEKGKPRRKPRPGSAVGRGSANSDSQLVPRPALTRDTPVLAAAGAEGAVRARAPQVLAALAGAVVAFALTSPYTFLAWGEARQGLRFELQHMRQGEILAVLADPSGFLFHLKHLLAPGLGLPVLLALAGAVWVLARRRREWYPILLFAAVWFVMIGLAKVRYPRYELPLIAPLALLAIAPLEGLVRGRRLYQGLPALGGLLMLFWCSQIALGLQGPRPQDQALAYLLQVSQPGQAVGFSETPWFADPPVDYCNGGQGICDTPLWATYRRERRPVMVLGPYAPGALSAARAPWFVTTDFGLGAWLRAGDAPALGFRSALTAEYQGTAVGGTPFALVPWPLGPDWRYPWPRIEVWDKKE